MEMNFTDLLPYLASVMTGVAGWLTGQRKQKNDFLKDLQASIDLLAKENRRLIEENLELRKELSELKIIVHEFQLRRQKK
jgi:hypothetical protein